MILMIHHDGSNIQQDTFLFELFIDPKTQNSKSVLTPIYHTRDHMTTQLFVGLDKLLMMHRDGSTMKPIEIVNTNKTSLDNLQQLVAFHK